MQLVASITVDTSALERLTETARANAQKAIAETSFSVQTDAQMMAPVDTGALRNSIMASQQSPFLWWVHDGVEYGIYQELGTYKMRAQPFMVPAVERNRQTLTSNLSGIFA